MVAGYANTTNSNFNEKFILLNFIIIIIIRAHYYGVKSSSSLKKLKSHSGSLSFCA